MRTRTWLKLLNPLLLMAALAGAQERVPPSDSDSKSSRPEYDALFSEILKNLPQENRAKVDSLKKTDRVPVQAEGAKTPITPETQKKELAEKRKQEMDGLSKDVKERVEKAISDLEQRKKERQLEFKVLDEH